MVISQNIVIVNFLFILQLQCFIDVLVCVLLYGIILIQILIK